MTEIIFFDTDCISSFLWTKTEYIRIHCFGINMIIQRQVYNEISKVPHLKQRIDSMVTNKNLKVEDIDIAGEDNILYFNLTDHTKLSTLPLIGRGEAAAIVLSKKYNGILASYNLRDIKYYVESYGLDHITTSKIIHRVVNEGIITVSQADLIWIQMIAKKRKLPFNTFTEYLNNLI